MKDREAPVAKPPNGWFGALGMSHPLTIRTTRGALQLRPAELAVFPILEADRRAIRAKVRRPGRRRELSTIPTETVRNRPPVILRHLAVPSGTLLVRALLVHCDRRVGESPSGEFLVRAFRGNLPDVRTFRNREQFVKVRAYTQRRDHVIVLASPNGPVPFIVPPIIVLYNGIAHHLVSHTAWPKAFDLPLRQCFKPPNKGVHQLGEVPEIAIRCRDLPTSKNVQVGATTGSAAVLPIVGMVEAEKNGKLVRTHPTVLGR